VKVDNDVGLYVSADEEDDDDDDLDSDDGNKKPKARKDQGILKKARSLVGFFNLSTQAMEKLKELQKNFSEENRLPLDVIFQDVITRWWSILSMLDRLFEIRKALALYDVPVE
jgi:hypothetical protein